MIIPQSIQNDFKTDWDFQTGYYKAIENIIKSNAKYFVYVRVANPEQDMKQATDFIVVIEGGEIAVRIRRDNCRFRDLTIRSKRLESKTEIDKIKEGWARYYLYCWTDINKNISEWIFVDLNKIRELNLLDNRDNIPNGDGTYFIAIPFDELNNKECIISYSLS